MIDRPIIVVGQMRSGCALVTEVVNRLGFHAGTVLHSPMPPSWRLDWQEVELSRLLVQRLFPTQGWWLDYIKRRQADSRMLGFEGRIVLNCQYMALCWRDVLEAMRLLELDPFVIRTYRDPESIQASLDAHPGLKREDQVAIQTALYRDVAPGIEVGYDFAVGYPGKFVRILAEALGNKDDEAQRAAIASVGQPTRYEPCPMPRSWVEPSSSTDQSKLEPLARTHPGRRGES